MSTHGDHRDYHRTDRPKPPPATAPAGARWWEMKPTEAAASISANLEFWATNQRYRLMLLFRWASLYGNVGNMSAAGFSLEMQAQLRSLFGDQISYNVTGSVIDTYVSKMTRNKAKPSFLTDDGNYDQQELAKNRDAFVGGVFYENDTYAKTRIACRDSAVWGPGIIGVFPKAGRVVHERVLPSEMFVDEVEAITGNPRQMHRIKWVDKTVLQEEFPKKSKEIEDVKWEGGEALTLSRSLADMICVRESWRLPSGPGADDGAHIITVHGLALTDVEPWERDTFPFAILAYTPPMYGFWPRGLAEEGQSIQLEINKIAWYIQESIERGGTMKIFLKTGSKVSADHINNQFTAIIEGDEAPQYVTPPLVQPELYGYIETLIRRYYNMAGISPTDATSTKPSGELSGEALRVIHDIGTERFMSKGQQFEEFHCQIARLSIYAAMDIVEDAKARAKKDEKPEGYMVRGPHRATMREVDFNDLGFKPNESFNVKCWPVSLLPSDPAGRTQRVEDLAQAGYLDRDTARDLLDFPDTGAVTTRLEAEREFITKTLNEMLDDGEPYTPEGGLDNMPLFLEQATMYYANAKRLEVPEKRLQLVRDLITAIKEEILKAQPPPIPVAPTVAPANPAPTPTSALIPNVNA